MGVRGRCPRVGDGPGVRGAAERAAVPALPGSGARAGAQHQQRRRAAGLPRLPQPVAGVQWLAQRDQKPRQPSGIPSGPAVWEANGNHCAFCGKPRWLCDRLRIGLTAQHVTPVALGGIWGPLIPFCSRCQEMSAAALRETRSVLGEITRLDGGGTADRGSC